MSNIIVVHPLALSRTDRSLAPGFCNLTFDQLSGCVNETLNALKLLHLRRPLVIVRRRERESLRAHKMIIIIIFAGEK